LLFKSNILKLRVKRNIRTANFKRKAYISSYTTKPGDKSLLEEFLFAR
jgi:hypothetical protein